MENIAGKMWYFRNKTIHRYAMLIIPVYDTMCKTVWSDYFFLASSRWCVCKGSREIGL